MKNNSFIKWVSNIIFIILIALATFFGMGPVLMADGTFQEKMLTLAVVILIYTILIVSFRYWIKKNK